MDLQSAPTHIRTSPLTMHCSSYACTSLLVVLLAARIVTSSGLEKAGRKELLSVPPVTPISNVKLGEETSVINLPLWNKRAKITTIVGFMTMPTVQAPAKLVTYAEQARELERAGNSSSIKPENINECNVGFRVSKVPLRTEDSGTLSGIVQLRRWSGNGWTALCSGTLLNSRLVATAAHCIYDTEKNKWMLSRSNPILVVASLNGKSDTKYRTAFATNGIVYTAYISKTRWQQSLLDNSDVAVLKLNSSLSGNMFRWSSPRPSVSPRRNYGYPAEQQDGFTLFFDESITTIKTGCLSYSSDLICDNISTEGGMSGGPVMNLQNSIQIGVCSGSRVGGCPAYYAGLTGRFSLSGLVRAANCTVSTTSSGGRILSRATC